MSSETIKVITPTNTIVVKSRGKQGIQGIPAADVTWSTLAGKPPETNDLTTQTLLNAGIVESKGYTDAQILASLVSVIKSKGGIDCSTNPNYPAAAVNDLYYVTVAGKIGGAAGEAVEIGDTVICLITNTGGDQATVGGLFLILQTNTPGLSTVGTNLATLATPTANLITRINSDGSVTLTDDLDLNSVTFKETPTGAISLRNLRWDSNLETLAVQLDADTVHHLGRNTQIRGVNKTGSTIPKGSVVSITGAQGQRPTLVLTDGLSETLVENAIGVTNNQILNNAEGFVTTFGYLDGLDLSAFTDGDLLYLDGATPGALTNVAPTFPAYNLRVGLVINAGGGTSGTAGVRIDAPHSIGNLHNVTIATPLAKQVLIYDGTKWENAGITESIQVAASDETTPIEIGTEKVTFRLPYACTLLSVRASLTTAQATGVIITADVNLNGTSVLGTKLTLDNTEKTSVTANVAPTLVTTALPDDGEITLDIDQVGDGTAAGLKVTLIISK